MAGANTAEKLNAATTEEETPHRGRVLLVGAPEQPALARALEERGFLVVPTASVVQALTLVVAARVTLVVTGSGEVGESMLDALRALPAFSRKQDLPLIWLGTDGENEDALLRRGVSLFLRPPYPVEHLLTAAMFSA